jgi:teichuronic acid biosynthesis glycosyltransferase TuaC
MLTTGFPRFEGDLFGSFILELAAELVRQGIDVEVVAPHERGLSRFEEVRGVQVRRFRYCIPSSWQRVAYGGGIPSNLACSWVSKLQIPLFLTGFWWGAFPRIRYCDIIHCHWTISGLVAHAANLFGRRPIVLSVRGSDIHLLQGGMAGRANQKVYSWVDQVVAVSGDIAGKLEQSGLTRKKISVVYNGVDGRFAPRERATARRQLGLPEGCFILLFVGLLVPVKGLDILLEGIRIAGRENLFCVLVGDGSQRDELQQLMIRAGLAEQVMFAGRRPTEEVPVWMNAADALVLPSRSEGRPNVVLEAQASGLPVIATCVGGTPELVHHGENGLLVKSEDAHGLAVQIAQLMDDDPLRERLGKAGRESVLANGLTWEASARKMIEIYRQLLEA